MNLEDQKSNVDIRDTWLLLGLALFFAWSLLGFAVQSVTLKRVVFVLLGVSLVMKQRWVIYLMVIYSIFVSSLVPRNLSLAEPLLFFLKPLLLLGFLIFSLRFSDQPFSFRLGFDGRGWWTKDQNQTTDTLHATRPLSSGIIWIPVVLIAALLFLIWVPLDLTTDARWGIRPAAFRALTVFWFLAFLWLMISSFFWWYAERDHDPFRAKVYIRSLFCQQIHRELAPIEKMAAKKQNRKTS